MAEKIKVPAGVYDMVTRCMEQEFPEMHVVYIYNLLICDFFEKVVDDLILMC